MIDEKLIPLLMCVDSAAQPHQIFLRLPRNIFGWSEGWSEVKKIYDENDLDQSAQSAHNILGNVT